MKPATCSWFLHKTYLITIHTCWPFNYLKAATKVPISVSSVGSVCPFHGHSLRLSYQHGDPPLNLSPFEEPLKAREVTLMENAAPLFENWT